MQSLFSMNDPMKVDSRKRKAVSSLVSPLEAQVQRLRSELAELKRDQLRSQLMKLRDEEAIEHISKRVRHERVTDSPAILSRLMLSDVLEADLDRHRLLDSVQDLRSDSMMQDSSSSSSSDEDEFRVSHRDVDQVVLCHESLMQSAQSCCTQLETSAFTLIHPVMRMLQAACSTNDKQLTEGNSMWIQLQQELGLDESQQTALFQLRSHVRGQRRVSTEVQRALHKLNDSMDKWHAQHRDNFVRLRSILDTRAIASMLERTRDFVWRDTISPSPSDSC